MSDFLTALKPYVKTTLGNDSVGKVKYHYGDVGGMDFNSADQDCTLQHYTNIDMPLAINIDPDPMQFINNDKITNLNDLLNSVQNNFDTTSGADLIDSLSAAPVYWNMRVPISMLNDLGKEYKKEQEEQEKTMILSIVFGLFVNVGCFFLGPIQGAVMGSIVALGQLMAEYAITGKLSVRDIVISFFPVLMRSLRLSRSGA